MAQMIIIGSIGLDDISTPFGEIKNALGGSAIYASYAASFFGEFCNDKSHNLQSKLIHPEFSSSGNPHNMKVTENKSSIGLVAIAGEDLPKEHFELLRQRNIDLQGVTIHGKNFRWSGKYEFDMNQAHTLKTELNSLADFTADIPAEYKDAKYILLANNPPELQLKVIEQLRDPKFIVLDSMNLWIQIAKEKLIEIIKKVNVLVINDAEARMLFDTVNLAQAAKKALALGVQYCIIKKGEHGALLFAREFCGTAAKFSKPCNPDNENHNQNNNGNELHFNAPGYPLEVIKDPTGCGDCFAGGFIGYLAATDNLSFANIKKAVVYGSTIASFNAEDFSLERMKRLTLKEIDARYKEFERMRSF
ncbi:sugar kinase [Candidatus Woesearchaeota archaeon]|nr:sugar kinase [Candidatus Woesearchaeota archaeon]